MHLGLGLGLVNDQWRDADCANISHTRDKGDCRTFLWTM
jgi:hypothetical protein